MKPEIRNYIEAAGKICTLLTFGLALGACGSGGGDDQTAGIGGTGIAVGKITQFGSIFVNGRKYNTDDSSFIIDGDPSLSQDSLEIGMVVRLKVETSNGELTSKAVEVVYDDEIQGPVTGLAPLAPGATQRSFSVFGQTVTINATGTVFRDTTFAGLADDDIVEISGLRESASMIRATYVEKKGVFVAGASEVELRGEVDQFLGGTTFEIGGTVINIVPGVTVIDVPGGVLVDGMFVEVEGVIQGDLSVDAAEIEFEDDAFDDDFDEISLQGIIANFNSISDFEIDGLPVNAATAQSLPALPADPNGLEVEVEGNIVGGVLIADEFELREGESRVEALVQSGSVNTATGSFEVYYQSLPGTITVRTDSQTLFKDEISSGSLPNLTLGDLVADNFVRIEGQEIAGELVASVVKRIDDPGVGNREFELQGAVDAFFFEQWIEILGIRFVTDDGTETEYEDSNGTSLTATQFFGQLIAVGGVGTLVEIKDDAVTYGVADEVEFED